MSASPLTATVVARTSPRQAKRIRKRYADGLLLGYGPGQPARQGGDDTHGCNPHQAAPGRAAAAAERGQANQPAAPRRPT